MLQASWVEVISYSSNKVHQTCGAPTLSDLCRRDLNFPGYENISLIPILHQRGHEQIMHDAQKGALHHFPKERGSFASPTPRKMNGVGRHATAILCKPTLPKIPEKLGSPPVAVGGQH